MKFGRPKEGNFRPITLNLDPSEVEKFVSSLPKNKFLSEIVRDFIHQENERIEAEKKETPPARGAIIYSIQKDKNLSKQTTLEMFKIDKSEWRNQLASVNDGKKLCELRDFEELKLSDLKQKIKSVRKIEN